MANMDDLDRQLLEQMREDFLVEAQEIFARLNLSLSELEQHGGSDVLNTIFRGLHTLKGTAGFVGLTAFQTLAHKLEDVFGALRDETLTVTPELIDLVFDGLRVLSDIREEVARGGAGDADIAALIAQLNAALQGELPASAALPAVTTVVESRPEGTESTLRVRVETLDRLIGLVGEMITVRNALQVNVERVRDQALMDNTAVLDRLIGQLQTEVTAMRLVPISRLFARFSGVVRAMAREHSKQVTLLIESGDTPIDRNISEQMYDPLVHLLRNAVSHGLESPEERQRLGKPAEAIIRLSAKRQADTVTLRVADDGQGVNPDQVRQIAVERGLFSAEEAAALSDDQAIRLIFRAGFSTASQVTEASGRGVGLDVVLEHVRHLRGRVDIETDVGRGTTFIIQLPLTLAILQVLLIRIGERTYALPMHTVHETLRIDRGTIQAMQQGKVFFLRGAALPVHYLSHRLGLDGHIANGGEEIKHAVVVHMASGDEVWVVEEILGKQQVVIQSLPSYVGAVRGVEGAAILPDGSVTLILDAESLTEE